MAGSEGFHRLVDGLDQRQHGLLQLALELRLMSLKPLPPIVSFEAAQKFEAGFTKVWFAGGVGKEEIVMMRTSTDLIGVMPAKALKLRVSAVLVRFLFNDSNPRGYTRNPFLKYKSNGLASATIRRVSIVVR